MGFGNSADGEKKFFGKIGRLYYGHPFLGSFIRFNCFKNAIKGKSFSAALDAGCGNGDYCFYLAEEYPPATIKGFDIDAKQIAKNSKRAKSLGLKNLSFFTADLNSFRAKGEYDLAYSIDSLEHVEKNSSVVVSLCAALKKNGLLFIHMPSRNTEVSFLPNSFFKKYNAFEEEQHPGKNFSLGSIEKLLMENGMKIEKSGKTFGFFGELAWEFDQFFQEKELPLLRALFLPLSKAIGIIDTILENKKGNAFFVLARKVRQ